MSGLRRSSLRTIQAVGQLVKPMQKGSMRGCVLALTFSAVGAGILGLPWAVATLGWGLGMGLLALCAVLSCMALCMLVEIRERSGHTSYASVVEAYFGRTMSQILALILAIGSFGSCCASCMFATDFVVDSLETEAINHVLRAFNAHDADHAIGTSGLTRPLVILVLVAALLVLSWPRDITRWRYASVVSVIVLLYVSVALVIKAFVPSDSESGARCTTLASDGFVLAVWSGVPKLAQAASVFIFSFCCHFNLFPVVENLANPTMGRARVLCVAATVMQASLYVLVGLAGYITWKQALLRSSASGNVLSCWGVNDVLIALGRLLMICTLLVSGALNIHPTRENMLRFIFTLCSEDMRKRFLVRRDLDWNRYVTNPPSSPGCSVPQHLCVFAVSNASCPVYGAVTGVLLALLALIVVVVPSVLDVLGFIGGFCGVSLMFLFPSALYIRICGACGGTSSLGKVGIGPVLILFGVLSLLGFIAVGKSVHDILFVRH